MATVAKQKTTMRKNPGSKAPKNGMAAGAPAELAEAKSLPLLGEIITWSAGGPQPYAGVLAALKGAGLNDTVARAMLPRHAFARACRKLGQDRVINLVDETANELVFQFTRVAFDNAAKEYRFNTEAKVTLTKSTGDLDCPAAPELATAAAQLLAREIATRTPGDIGNVVQRLFEQEADLFPIREQGGAYFVPDRHQAFTLKIVSFLEAMGGTVHRWPVPRGTPHGDRAAREAVADGFRKAVKGHLDAVGRFDATTRDSTWETRLEEVRETRFKAEAYRDLLQDQVSEIDEALAKAAESIREQHRKWAAVKDVPHVRCDHCGVPNAVDEGAASCVCKGCGKAFEIEW